MAKREKEVDIYERTKDGRIIGEKPEFRNVPGHHLGASPESGGSGAGYTLLKDGKYELAPADQNSFAEIMAQQDALLTMLRHVQETVQGQLQCLAKRKQQWFSRIAHNVYRPEDAMHMSYNFADGRITFTNDTPAAVQNKRLEEEMELDVAGAGTGKQDA